LGEVGKLLDLVRRMKSELCDSDEAAALFYEAYDVLVEFGMEPHAPGELDDE
jgi:hypothetical protein